jgi:hypothetical protein
MREEPPKPRIEFRSDRYLCIAVARRLGFEPPQSIRGGHRGLRSGLEKPRDLTEWRLWAHLRHMSDVSNRREADIDGTR